MIGATFHLPKRTDTHADGLAVGGLAYVLARIGDPPTERTITIRDEGTLFSLSVDPPLRLEELDRWDGDPLYPYIKLKGDPRAPVDSFDYDKESAILLEARERGAPRKRPSKGTATGADLETEKLRSAAESADPETALLRVFNGMRKGFMGDIDMNAALRKSPPKEALWRRFAALAEAVVPGPAESPLDIQLKASQWFLPLSGKGVTRAKPDGASPGQFPEQHLDWFETWIRYVGMYRALTAHGFGDDLKLAVIAPADVDSALLPTIRAALRDAGIFGRKIDVRAPLELARTLVHYSEEYQRTPVGARTLRFRSRSPREVIRGLYVTTYKKMGAASSVMNVAFLGVPSWAVVEDRQSAEAFLANLDDLDRFQNVLRDDISEDIETLRVMGRFLSSGRLAAALDFFGRMAFDVFHRLAAKRYAHILSIDTVRGIVMGHSAEAPVVARIIDDEGFQRVAKAVRAATIHAQLYDDSALQPRYGLAQAWRQKAAHKHRFVEELARFASQFNADLVRVREVDQKAGRKRKYYPSLLTTTDLESVFRLIDEPGSSSSLVSSLLLAFGFAEVPKKDPAATTSPIDAQKEKPE